MSDAGNWCLIESDPGVFTEMLKGFGVNGLQVEELYTLDEAEFATMRPIHGLVFLFKWRQGDEPCGLPAPNADIFFAQQVMTNACATQALVNCILNLDEKAVSDLTVGETLNEFRSFCKDFDPATRGLCLSNSEPIREVHNSFSRQQLWELDIKSGKDEDNYHFVTFMPIGRKVYELDGLREYPMEVGVIPEGKDWLDVIRPAIQARIHRYAEGEIHFNLMALVSDRKLKYVKRLEELATLDMDTDAVAEEICHLQQLIEEEDIKGRKQRTENVRRRHNYVPFIVELLKILAEEKKLVPLVQQATVKAEAKRRREIEAKGLKPKV